MFKSRTIQAIINVIALAVTLVVNWLATALPLGGRTTGEISDSFNSLFVPAGYVFAIWGLIYLALTGFVIYQALPRQQNNPWVRATGWWFAVSSAANTLWIVLWHFGYYALTLAVMLVLLASLIVIYRRLAAQAGDVPTAARWLVKFPFSLYLGWISVATIANAAAVLSDLGWNGQPLTPVVWTVLMIAAAAGLSLLMSYRHRDLTYAGVIIWALIGILVRQADMLPIVTASGLAVLVVAAGALLLGSRQTRPMMGMAR